MHIYGNTPYAPEKKINEDVNRIVESFISTEEVASIVEYLYCKEDALEIMRRVQKEKKFMEENKVLGTREERILDQHRVSLPVIEYKAFRLIVTNYIFESHMAYLEPFNKVFRMFDTDNNGVLNEVAFTSPDRVSQARRLRGLAVLGGAERHEPPGPPRPLQLQPNHLLLVCHHSLADRRRQ